MFLSGAHALCCCPHEVTKAKDKKFLLFVLHCLTFPQQNTAGELRTWKKSKLLHCWSTYRQYGKQNSSGNLCAGNLATLIVCIWKPGYFHKDIIPKVNNSNFWKETNQTKNLQLAKRKRILSEFCWWITWNPVEQGSLPSFLAKVSNTSLMCEDEVKIW